MKIIKKFQRIIKRIKCASNPIDYAKSLGVKIGEGTRIYSPDVNMFSTEPWLITIGNNCHITYGVRFLTHDGGTLVIKEEECSSFVICGDIHIGNDVYIGERTTVLPGVTIGDNVIVGCNSVVTKDLPSNTVCAGVPCKVINSKEGYIKKIKDIMEGKNERYYSDLNIMHSKNPNRKKDIK